MRTRSLALVALLLVAWLAALAPAAPGRARADTLDEQALAIERQLLCPQCVNLRLDVCDTLLCRDMRAQIRERLSAGEPPQQIIASFEQRYGRRVLADPPYRGARRALLGWVVAATLLVAALGGGALVAMRRGARATAAAPAVPDDRWLDEQLAREEGGR
jgi:cytochrome c-type biogenesis protein CcmH